MTRHDVRLSDKFDLTKSPVVLNGTHALVRLMLNQKARDRALGLNTAGYVTGYRGSPLGGLDLQMQRAGAELSAADIRFQSAINEDLAATSIWGAQQAELRGEGRFDGVFGLWYGKGPGVDRSGDAVKHANLAGTSPNGGVLMALGDDHTAESSTTFHQSEYALVDARIPVLNPAGVQEILDFGVLGYALSRFSGTWVGLKVVKDTVEATAVVDARPDRITTELPGFELPEDGLNIRLIDTPAAQEERLALHKLKAAQTFARANGLDHRVLGQAGAKVGIVSTGKSWLDLTEALETLGIDEKTAIELGVTTYKVGMPWPLDPIALHMWAERLDLMIVVEEKRKLMEGQIKEALYALPDRPSILGGWAGDGTVFLPEHGALDPVMIAERLGEALGSAGIHSVELAAARQRLARLRAQETAGDLVSRLPYFCSGCPHNTSTKVPKGMRGSAGIGCHYLVQWMDRDTLGFTHMGGEGANWVGEAPFSTRNHIIQNIGDGTYNHSGVQAIRAALAEDTTMTFKVLFNDAVALTGGQKNDGDLTAAQITCELKAMGVENLAVVYDPGEELDWRAYPKDVPRHLRDDLLGVQESFARLPGVSVIVYVQTCAAEKRRRRRKGTFPDPDRRVFINPDICEGCGDCGVQSNCVSIVPLETEFGRKRSIDQSSCNKDFSCLNGFCPAFVTVEGGKLRDNAPIGFMVPDLPDPVLPAIDRTYNMVISGVGGTGVVTIGATLAMAAHLDGKAAAMIEMAGLAQKGGTVNIHLRLARAPSDISAVRVPVGGADAVIGGDLVVSAGARTLALMDGERTGAVVNTHQVMTGAFCRDPDFRIPQKDLTRALHARLGEKLRLLDANELAVRLLGDSIYSNMIVLGAGWQDGLVPIAQDAIFRAIDLNGAAPEANRQAFLIGRWAAEKAGDAAGLLAQGAVELPKTLAERIAFREQHLKDYGSVRLASRYRRTIDGIEDEDLRLAAALGYHKLLSYKDEYEVARLLGQTRDQVSQVFEGDWDLKFQLAPPLISRSGTNGRPRKRAFSGMIARWIPSLARFRVLRGTMLDPFGHTQERKLERALIRQYEEDLKQVLPNLDHRNKAEAIELLRIPLAIKGFGPVKMANAQQAENRRLELLKRILEVAPVSGMAAE